MEENSSAQTNPPANTAKRRVLCIEDEVFISELYARALTKAGYEVKTEIDGMKGLSEAMTNTYDIILLDIMVPNMIGVDILKHLREEKTDLKAKIVITTNMDQGKATRSEIEKQADGYLVKAEITPKQLVAFLDSIK